MERPMQKLNDLSRCLTLLEPDSTVIAVIEMSQSSWLVAGIVPGVERQPLKKLAVNEAALLKLLHRWREEAEEAGYGSHASLSLSRPVGTAFGWRAGSGHATSRPMSFMHRA
jgi:transposase